ncbi:hypothetical protein BGZ75_007183 [Mortierella antarctica]|nr:hypothetical protein BGZ75_007183 [Mortierella antarctica]
MLGKSPDRRSPVDMDLVKKISSTPPYRSDLTHQPTLSQEKPMTLSEGAFSDSSELGAARQPQPRAPSPGLVLGDMIIPVHPGTTTDFMEKHFERRWQYSTTRHYQHDQRDCNHIARCLEKILKLRFFRFELTKQLIAVKLEPHEDSITYADRLQQLVKLSRADREGTERFTVSVVAESLPDGRYERLKAHFGSEDSIRTVHDIIHLVRKPPGTLSGRTTDRAEWVWRHFRQAESEEQPQDPRKVAYRLNKSLNHRKNCSSSSSSLVLIQHRSSWSLVHIQHKTSSNSLVLLQQQEQQQEAFEKHLHEQQQQQSSVRAEETGRPSKRRRTDDLCTEEECIQRNALHRPEVWVRYPHLRYDKRQDSTRPPRREESSSSSTARPPRREESTSDASARCTEDSCVRKGLRHRQSECWIRNPHLRRERPSRATTGSSSSNYNATTTTTTSNPFNSYGTSNSTRHSPSSYANEAPDAWCPEENCYNRNLKHRADQCWIRHPHLRVSRSKKPAARAASSDTFKTVRFEVPNCGEDECLQNHIVHRPEECWVRHQGRD